MPKISVVMLVYNREALVVRAIESIVNQTFHDFEFIIVNNGSTDSSGAIADGYAAKDGRITVIHRGGGNIGSGRNAGLDACSGDYVAFIDDDDYAEPDFLEFLYGLAREHDADIAVCGSTKEEDGAILPNGIYQYDEKYIMNAEQATDAFLRRIRFNAAMPTKLLRRSLFDNIRFSDTGSYDDISTTYRYFANAGVVVAHGLPKYCFYRHPNNNSSAATKHHLLNPRQLGEYLAAFRERTNYISQVLPRLAGQVLYSEWSYMISMVEKIHRYGLTNCDEPLEFMRAELRAHWDEFYNGTYTEVFERDWMDAYVKRTGSSGCGLRLERVCFPVTLKCNLRCKLCAERSPYYALPYHPDFNGIKRQINMWFALADFIERFDLTGGEPFLRKDLASILEYLQAYRGGIGILRIVTNGTILPPEGFIESAERWGASIFVIVDNYPASTRCGQICASLERHNIPFEKRDYSKNLHHDGWVDYGDCSHKQGKLEAKSMFEDCMVPQLGFFTCMVDGSIFPCAKARLLYEHGLPAEHIDCYDTQVSVTEKRRRLRELLGKTELFACQYCNGLRAASPRFPPAQQLGAIEFEQPGNNNKGVD